MMASRMWLALLAPLAAAATFDPWPSKVISWWYGADNNWPLLVKEINQTDRLPLVTSVMTYCGYDVADDGSFVVPSPLSDACQEFLPALGALGVRREFVINAGNCSIDSYREFWNRSIAATMLEESLKYNVSGWNIDMEPQGDSCKGGATGDAADAFLFASWLNETRAALNPHGVRVTVAVANWSPVLSQYKVLAAAADRIQNMGLYNLNDMPDWEYVMNEFLSGAPREKLAPGLGCWTDGKTDWWETQAGAEAKVNKSIAEGLSELALFRLLPSPTSTADDWPLAFWWDALRPFLA